MSVARLSRPLFPIAQTVGREGTRRRLWDGLMVTVRAAARGASVGKGGVMLMLSWECALSNYQRQQGMLLPIVGEAVWLRPQGRKTYFRGTVTSLSHELS